MSSSNYSPCFPPIGVSMQCRCSWRTRALDILLIFIQHVYMLTNEKSCKLEIQGF